MSDCVFRRRLSPAQEQEIIIEEVMFLLNDGYRKEERAQIMEGMQVAIEGYSAAEWKFLAELPLDAVMNEFMALGVN